MRHRLWHALALTVGLYLLFSFRALDDNLALKPSQPSQDFHAILSRLLP